MADKEYINIVDTRLKSRQESLVAAQSQRRDSESHSPGQFGLHNLYTLLVPSNVRKRFFGEESEFFCGTVWLHSRVLQANKTLSNVTYQVSRTGCSHTMPQIRVMCKFYPCCLNTTFSRNCRCSYIFSFIRIQLVSGQTLESNAKR